MTPGDEQTQHGAHSLSIKGNNFIIIRHIRQTNWSWPWSWRLRSVFTSGVVPGERRRSLTFSQGLHFGRGSDQKRQETERKRGWQESWIQRTGIGRIGKRINQSQARFRRRNWIILLESGITNEAQLKVLTVNEMYYQYNKKYQIYNLFTNLSMSLTRDAWSQIFLLILITDKSGQ